MLFNVHDVCTESPLQKICRSDVQLPRKLSDWQIQIDLSKKCKENIRRWLRCQPVPRSRYCCHIRFQRDTVSPGAVADVIFVISDLKNTTSDDFWSRKTSVGEADTRQPRNQVTGVPLPMLFSYSMKSKSEKQNWTYLRDYLLSYFLSISLFLIVYPYRSKSRNYLIRYGLKLE